MQGGRARALIDQGKVETFPLIVRFENDHVVFADGRELHPDLVLFATGFQPANDHLANLGTNLYSDLHDLESSTVRGLYFLGIDHGRNFQSRFIRGIRNDAAFLADRLQRKLKVAAHHE
jgi:putative flavoprotein involved in K+ transport